MSSILLRLLILVVILYLLRRFLASIMGLPNKRSPKASGSVANYMVKDPVCGMYMDSRLALRLENGAETVYFCSDACKKKYLNPENPVSVPVGGKKVEAGGHPESR